MIKYFCDITGAELERGEFVEAAKGDPVTHTESNVVHRMGLTLVDETLVPRLEDIEFAAQVAGTKAEAKYVDMALARLKDEYRG